MEKVRWTQEMRLLSMGRQWKEIRKNTRLIIE